ncbi:hypothetical protein [Candidatus Spongiihabitans sp.]|uniref:hypothetical protein n=1 Tax=Candidatus Spongiihabitans sp. TaxID=3101308 RepID=UPI003C7C8C72
MKPSVPRFREGRPAQRDTTAMDDGSADCRSCALGIHAIRGNIAGSKNLPTPQSPERVPTLQPGNAVASPQVFDWIIGSSPIMTGEWERRTGGGFVISEWTGRPIFVPDKICTSTVGFGFLDNCSCIAPLSYVHVAMRRPTSAIHGIVVLGGRMPRVRDAQVWRFALPPFLPGRHSRASGNPVKPSVPRFREGRPAQRDTTAMDDGSADCRSCASCALGIHAIRGNIAGSKNLPTPQSPERVPTLQPGNAAASPQVFDWIIGSSPIMAGEWE